MIGNQDTGFIGGGFSNYVWGLEGAVAGGAVNQAGIKAFVGGGLLNHATGQHSVIAGGHDNQATALNASVLGGYQNLASAIGSTAFGNRAKAVHNGSIVISDNSSGDFYSGRDHEFAVRTDMARFYKQGYNADVDMDIMMIQREMVGADTTQPSTLDRENWSFGILGYQHGAGSHIWDSNWDAGMGMYLNGTLRVIITTDGHHVVFSDRRLKEDIVKVENVLDKVKTLNLVTYRMKDDKVLLEKKSLGMIAQDVQAVFPELVDEHDGKLMMDYTPLGAVAIGAIQELDKEKDREIAELKAENAKLKTEMADILTRLSAVEAKMNQ